jgi:hypothetical protein
VVEISLDDVAAFFSGLPKDALAADLATVADQLSAHITRNTRAYQRLFCQAIDSMLPAPEVDLVRGLLHAPLSV